jgi:integrase
MSDTTSHNLDGPWSDPMPQTLTDAIVKRLPTACDKRIVYDAAQPGFGVRITANGHRSFVVNYVVRATGRERRYTIGSFPNWSTVAARAEARRLRRLIDNGGDPLGEIEDARAAPTVADLIARFEDEHFARLRPGTRNRYREQIKKHIRPHFGPHTKVAEVDFASIDRLHRKITAAGSPYAANRVHSLLSKMFALAIRWGMADTNPCKGVERNLESGRKRYLSGDELVRLIQALSEYPNRQSANIIRVLLMTGARRGEVLGMRWEHIDLATGVWSKPASAVKQKVDHTVPLSAPVRQLLSEIRAAQPDSEFVFPAARGGHRLDINNNWRRICTAAKIDNLRIHDLRHSFASQLASGGATLPLIGSLLGHSKPSTTARYSHLFIDPQRAAVEKIGAIVDNAGKQPVAPTPIKQGR